MRNNYLFLLLISLQILLVMGCSKENTEPQTKPKPKLYIRGNFGSESIEFLNYTLGINNYYEYPANPVSNGFSLIMHEKAAFDKTRFIQIEIARIDMDTLKTPWVNNPNPIFPKTYVSLSLIDLDKTNVQFDANDSINYGGSQISGDPVYLKINAIIGDTIEGIFNGDIKTKTGLMKHVTNGEFRVKFQRKQL